MVNGNVLERRKRDGLGHWGSERLAVPQPAPGLIPATGGLEGLAWGCPGTFGEHRPLEGYSNVLGSQASSCPVAMVWGQRGWSWPRAAPNLGRMRGSRWEHGDANHGSVPGFHGTKPPGIIPEGFWGDQCWGDSKRSPGCVPTGSAGCNRDRCPVLGCSQGWHLAAGLGSGGSLGPSLFPSPPHVAPGGGWFRFAVSSYSHFLTCERLR